MLLDDLVEGALISFVSLSLVFWVILLKTVNISDLCLLPFYFWRFLNFSLIPWMLQSEIPGLDSLNVAS